HLLLSRQRISILPLHLPDRDSKDAESVGTQLLESFGGLVSPVFIERLGSPGDDDGPTDGKDALRLALGNEEVLGATTDHYREALAVEVEGNLVHLRVVRNGRVLMLQDGVVQRALDAGLKMTVQIQQPEDVFIVLAENVHVAVEHDLAFGQGARLVA